MRHKKIILLEHCVDRQLYRLASRNLSLGVYNAAEKDFIGIRQKFNTEFLSSEYHWDTGEPFGTASPLEALEKLPDEILLSTDSPALFAWLREMREHHAHDVEEEEV
ncbi:hypothetical protein EBZ39_00440 [bacterium]|nr:hypothetical protein [bacterium]